MDTITTLTLIELTDWLATRPGDFPASLVRYYNRHGLLTERQEAAARRMWAEANRPAPEAPANPVTAVGFFIVDGTVYKVKAARGTGNLYVMKRLADGSWEYVRGGLRLLSEDDRITPEQAAQHGIDTGICIFCNAELDDADGLGKVVGVGPVCARKHLGLTQRQLADRLGVRPEARVAPAPEVPVAPMTEMTMARRAVRYERLYGREMSPTEVAIVDRMMALHGPEVVYMDGEVFGPMGAYLD